MIESGITAIRHGLATLNNGRVKCSILLMLIFFTMQVKSQSVGIGTQNPHPSALLDINSSNAGLLIPRVSLTGIYDSATIIKPARGLLVFNIAEAGQDSVKVVQGYYFFNGTSWQALSIHGNAAGDMLYWDGRHWKNLPAGQYGQYLAMCDSIPSWGGCLPKVNTIEPVNASNLSANSGGVILSNGGSPIIEKGIVWDSLQNPSISSLNKSINTSDSNSYHVSISGLMPNTLYYIKAYAVNIKGVAYGEEKTLMSPQINYSGLLAYYPFSGNAGDSSGNNKHASVSGATLAKDRHGLDNAAYYFNGLNNFIDAGFLPPNLRQARTLAAWFKYENAPLTESYSIMSYGSNTPSCNQAGGNMSVDIGAPVNSQRVIVNGNCTANVTYSLVNSDWHHITVTYDPQSGNTFDKVKIYIDGVLQTNIENYNGSVILNTLNYNNLKIGYDVSTNTRHFKGWIDEVMIYNRALTENEVYALATR